MEVTPVKLAHEEDQSPVARSGAHEPEPEEEVSDYEPIVPENGPTHELYVAANVDSKMKEFVEDGESDEDEYDPEIAYSGKAIESKARGQETGEHHDRTSTSTDVVESPDVVNELEKAIESPKAGIDNNNNNSESENESDYDPESSIRNHLIIKPSEPVKTTPSTVPKLPPKPPVSLASTDPTGVQNQLLKEAYQAVMQSDVVKDPNFIKLLQSEQMKIIQEQLKLSNVNLPMNSSTADMNYDQVYSFNKPFKYVKDPIALIPVNKWCRRPNITKPMTLEEEAAYDKFLKQEAYYGNLQTWDEFPDKLRLFVGNLPTNTITKEDLFRIFSQYGDLIQITIKAGYGFIQFRTMEGCMDCIKGETDVPLHNKILRFDASRPHKAKQPLSQPQPQLSQQGRGRERTASEVEEEDNGNDSNGDSVHSSKKQKQLDVAEAVEKEGEEEEEEEPECYIYITKESSPSLVKVVQDEFSNSSIRFEVEDVSDTDLADVLSDAAYSGILGTCVIKETNVDVQTFESTSDGGVKFDEYADIDASAAVEIIEKFKSKLGEQEEEEEDEEENSPYSGSNSHSRTNSPAISLPAVPKRRPMEIGHENEGSYRQKPRFNNKQGGHSQDSHRYGGLTQRYGHQYGTPPPHPGFAPQAPPPGYGPVSVPTAQYGTPLQPQGFNNMNPIQAVGQPYVGQAPPPNYGVPMPPQSQYNTQFVQGPPQQNGLLSSLQNMDPASMQNMINLLQKQQQQQQFQQQQIRQPVQQQQPIAYPFSQSGAPMNYGVVPPQQQQQQQPNSQLNSLLSQLQSNTPNYNGQPQQQMSEGGQQTQDLMETLARLGGQR